MIYLARAIYQASVAALVNSEEKRMEWMVEFIFFIELVLLACVNLPISWNICRNRLIMHTAWKVSEYGVISVPLFLTELFTP